MLLRIDGPCLHLLNSCNNCRRGSYCAGGLGITRSSAARWEIGWGKKWACPAGKCAWLESVFPVFSLSCWTQGSPHSDSLGNIGREMTPELTRAIRSSGNCLPSIQVPPSQDTSSGRESPSVGPFLARIVGGRTFHCGCFRYVGGAYTWMQHFEWVAPFGQGWFQTAGGLLPAGAMVLGIGLWWGLTEPERPETNAVGPSLPTMARWG